MTLHHLSVDVTLSSCCSFIVFPGCIPACRTFGSGELEGSSWSPQEVDCTQCRGTDPAQIGAEQGHLCCVWKKVVVAVGVGVAAAAAAVAAIVAAVAVVVVVVVVSRTMSGGLSSRMNKKTNCAVDDYLVSHTVDDIDPALPIMRNIP